MKKRSKTLTPYLAALLLGALLSFAFAPYEIFPLAIIAPAGLLVLWLNLSAKQAFTLGFLFGLGLFGIGVYWVYISIHNFGGVAEIPAILITSMLIAILALFPATVGYFTNRYFPLTNTAKIIFAFPAIWVMSEWVRSWFATGFPWLFLGYSQTNSPLKGLAPLIGVYGISLAVLLTSSLLVNALVQLRKKNYFIVYSNLLILVAIWTISGLLSFIPWTAANGKPISISLVQGNIPQALKWSPEHLQLSFDRYVQLTEPDWGKTQLIIWPEAAIPLPLQNAADFIEIMDRKALASHSQLILGIPIQTADGKGYHNAIVSLGKDKQVYLKRRLVPFGEYIPLTPLATRFFNFMNIPISNLLPGNMLQPPLLINNIKILAAICYEIAFPDLISTRDPTVGIILTVTNDAWFGKSSAQAQHLQMAQMRALELKRPVLFVSNDGITAIITPNGKIIDSAPQYKSFVLRGYVQPMIGLTPWMRHGIDTILIMLLLFLGVAIKLNRKVKG